MAAAPKPEQVLWDYIVGANPYKPKGKQVEMMFEEIEWDNYTQSSDWKFKGQPQHIARAIRIPYCYTDPDTNLPVRDYLLIGYEGSGGV